MPPRARTTCKYPGCGNPLHRFPNGQTAGYCDDHLWVRRRSRQGMPDMTGSMMEVLRFLVEAEQEGFPFVPLPFAHGTTLRVLTERDWIFQSPGLDGTRYKITLRGKEALDVYTQVNHHRHDGMCPRCHQNPRRIRENGNTADYCLECERERERGRKRSANPHHYRAGLCSRCKTNPRHQYPGGSYARLCAECQREQNRVKIKRRNAKLLRQIAEGEAVPLCSACHEKPCRVYKNAVSYYCADCRRKKERRWKLTRKAARIGLRVVR